MKTFSVAAVQCHAFCEGDIADNVALVAERLRSASALGADLVAFPEATLSGYLLDNTEISDRALRVEDPPVQQVVALTKEYSVYCAFGFYERCDGKLYNSYAIAGDGLLIGVYRKVHIPPRERGLFNPGSGFKVFDLPFARIGLSVCYDNEFPESHTCLALLGAEVILMPSGWAEHWERKDYIEPCSSDQEVVTERQRWMHMMFGARCRDTGTYSVLINHSGVEEHGPSRFVGKSAVFAPTGKPVAEARAWDDELLLAEINADLLSAYRSMDAYALNARMPQAYGPLVDRKKGGANGNK
jgi:predicted amidohydrolase